MSGAARLSLDAWGDVARFLAPREALCGLRLVCAATGRAVDAAHARAVRRARAHRSRERARSAAGTAAVCAFSVLLSWASLRARVSCGHAAWLVVSAATVGNNLADTGRVPQKERAAATLAAAALGMWHYRPSGTVSPLAVAAIPAAQFVGYAIEYRAATAAAALGAVLVTPVLFTFAVFFWLPLACAGSGNATDVVLVVALVVPLMHALVRSREGATMGDCGKGG